MLEIAREWLRGCDRPERAQHRRAQTEEPLVRIGFLCPLVEQLREVADMSQPVGWPAQRRADSFGIVQTYQLAALFLEVGDSRLGQRLERTRKPRARSARAFGHAAFLAAIARQKSDDAIGLTELVGAKDQRVGCVQRHETRLFYARNLMKTVASPRKEKKPKTSVSVVMNTDDARAGSTLAARSPSGMSVPAVAATNMLMIIAAAMITPSHGLPVQSHTTSPATTPQPTPLAIPTAASLNSAFRVFAQVSSPSAMPRTMTVSVCVA